MKISLLAIIVTTFFITVPAVHAADGKAVFEANCQGCHGTEVFTRKDRRVNDLAGLNAQVRRCNFQLEKKLFDEEMDAIVQYLNQQFYKF